MRFQKALKAAVGRVAQRIKKVCRSRTGMAMQVMVLLLLPMGLLAALAMDGGRLYVVRGEMQVAADAAALAGASSFIDGEQVEDSAQARAEHFVTANPIGRIPAVLESLTINPDSGTLKLVLSYHTGSLLLAPAGLIMRSRAGARARAAKPGQTGRRIPTENRLHWCKEGEAGPGGADSAVVSLSS